MVVCGPTNAGSVSPARKPPVATDIEFHAGPILRTPRMGDPRHIDMNAPWMSE